MKFEEKVKSMTSKEIIMAMVNSLIPPPAIKVNMSTFGEVKGVERKFLGISLGTKKVCFGCAATNTICKIEGRNFTAENIGSRIDRSDFLGISIEFLRIFEEAINYLRCGDIPGYNLFVNKIGVAQIEVREKELLPILRSYYTVEDLQPYIRLADLQEELVLDNI